MRKNREVLDIGAGGWPAPGCTRALDRRPVKIKVTPSTLIEYKIASVENIPYPDNFFRKIVSRWSLGCRIFRKAAYKEISRVLMPGGRVEVRLLWTDRRYKKKLIHNLEDVNISLYKEYTGVYEGPKKRKTEFILCFRKRQRGTNATKT